MCDSLIKGKTYTIIIPSMHGRAYPDSKIRILVPYDKHIFYDGLNVSNFNNDEYQNNIYKLYGQSYRGK